MQVNVLPENEDFETCLCKCGFLQRLCIYDAGTAERIIYSDFCHCPYFGMVGSSIEELVNAGKIIRPAYKYVGHHKDYTELEDRNW